MKIGKWYLLLVFALFSFAVADISIESIAKAKPVFKDSQGLTFDASLGLMVKSNQEPQDSLVLDTGGGGLSETVTRLTLINNELVWRQFVPKSYDKSISLIIAKRSDCLNTPVRCS